MGKKNEVDSKLRKEGEFIPPDGGWGWMIVFAAGFSNLSALPALQQFGLLFRDRFTQLGITSSETTTIINMNSALTSCIGLSNGPVFKIFSYRQVSLAGAILIFISLLFTTFSFNFVTYLLSFSILYGAGYGISSSANALALNTFWKKRRRLATAFSWTTTGLGPILWPHIITVLFTYFGETGTILILAGFSLHTIFCAFLLHPVEWHSTKSEKCDNEEKFIQLRSDENQFEIKKKKKSGYISIKLKNVSVFSSQYLYNEDDQENPGYEITDPGIPMMIRANDGYFSKSRQPGSRLFSQEESNRPSRLPSQKPSMPNLMENHSKKSSTLYLNESQRNLYANFAILTSHDHETTTFKKMQSKRKISVTEIRIPESEIEDCPVLKAPHDLKADEKTVVETIDTVKVISVLNKEEQPLASSSNIILSKVDPQNCEYNRDSNSYLSNKNTTDYEEKKYLKDNCSNQSIGTTKQRRKSNNFNYEKEVLKQASMKLEQYLKDIEVTDQELKMFINCDLDDNEFKGEKVLIDDEDENKEEDLAFCQKVAMFFDLDLLKDFAFINLMLGITLANFNELNFSILTPFILGDYGMSKQQVAYFMSLLAGVDICVRFCIPFFAGKIGWDNNSFFLFGVLTMALGRVVLAYCQIYEVVLLVAVIIGFGKGLRTVFMALVIPSHVPLHKLPGASGIQLLTAGITYLTLGPAVGYIKDNASTAVTLHCLNIFTWLTAISWCMEKYIRRRQQGETSEEIVKT